MSISTYAELVTAITRWSKRSDLASMADDFITLAEAKINRRLRCWQQETTLASTPLVAGIIARPDGLIAFKNLNSDTNGDPPIEQKGLDFVNSHHSDGSIPLYYAWEAENLRFNTDAGNVYGTYYVGVPNLNSTDTTNWLLTNSPDLYLNACLAESYYYQFDDQRGSFYETKREGLIDDLNITDKNDRFSGNSLVMRVA